MSNGGFHLSYQLYSNAARTTVWGNGTGGTVTVSARLVRQSTQNFTVYGRIPALQGVKPAAPMSTLSW